MLAQTPLGANIQRWDGRIAQYVENARPTTILIQNDVALAKRLADEYDWLEVVYRYIPSSMWDDDLQYKMSSEEAVDRLGMPFANTRVIVDFNNEPNYSQKTLDHAVEIAQLCLDNNIRAVLLNTGVGRPEPGDIFDGRADRLLTLIINNPDKLFYGIHEYWAHDWRNGLGFHVERFRFVVDRARQIGLTWDHKWMICTEWGPDKINGVGGGWRVTYGDPAGQLRLFQDFIDCWESVYEDSPVLGVHPFVYGVTNKAEWGNHDLSLAPDLWDKLEAWAIERGEPVETAYQAILRVFGTTSPMGIHEVLLITSSWVNLRGAPAGEIVGKLYPGDLITVDDPIPVTEKLGRTTYHWIELPEGWVALSTNLQLTPVELDTLSDIGRRLESLLVMLEEDKELVQTLIYDLAYYIEESESAF